MLDIKDLQHNYIYWKSQIIFIHLNILKEVNDRETFYCVQAERALLERIGGDCDTAIGIYSEINNNNISLTAELFSVDGNHRYFVQNTKEINLAKELGREVGEKLKIQSQGSYKR